MQNSHHKRKYRITKTFSLYNHCFAEKKYNNFKLKYYFQNRIKDNDSSSSKENFDIIPFNPQFSTGLIADLVARLKQNNDNDVLHLITLKVDLQFS